MICSRTYQTRRIPLQLQLIRNLLVCPIFVVSSFVGCSEGDTARLVPPEDKGLHVPGDYATIQQALDAAVDGDEVVVAPGTYFESIVIRAVSVTLRSESGNPEDTILDGSRLADGVSLVLFDANSGGARAIRGFTLRLAKQALMISFEAESENVIENCCFLDNGPVTALWSFGASVDILNNVFLNNEGYLYGGAVRVEGVGRIIGNQFRNNKAIPFETNYLTQGGAICLITVMGRGGSLQIRDNTFVGNHCTDYGGAIHVAWFFDVQIVDNRFLDNVADICGGGVYVLHNENFNVNIEKNLFVGNDSPRGAAIGVDVSKQTDVRFNTIVNSKNGEGIHIECSTGVLIEGNLVAFGAKQGIRFASSSGALECNNSYGNGLANYGGIVAPSTNLTVDPRFCDWESQDFFLAADSPCLPGNNECSILIGAFAAGCESAPRVVDSSVDK